VRGSVPVPGPETVRYGGNTACVEVRAGNRILILDAGTGLRPLGEALCAEFGTRPVHATLLISHTHWDHLQGFPFFRPIYEASTELRIYGFETSGEGLATVFARQMDAPYFPLSFAQLPARVQFEELTSMQVQLGEIRVQAAFVNHPGVCAGYRLEGAGISVAYLPDHEPFHRTCGLRSEGSSARAKDFASVQDERLLEFVRGVDMLILDSQFDPDEYESRVGWGHSSVDDAVELAARAEVERLFLFHHDPSHHDDRMDRLVDHARTLAAKRRPTLQVDAAREGVKVEARAQTAGANPSH
jgi:phosphoribosyl 1,2-cyclic phosphodiesterase